IIVLLRDRIDFLAAAPWARSRSTAGTAGRWLSARRPLKSPPGRLARGVRCKPGRRSAPRPWAERQMGTWQYASHKGKVGRGFVGFRDGPRWRGVGTA